MSPISAENFRFQLNLELFCICKIVPTYPSPTSSSTGALQRRRRRFHTAGWLGATGLDLNRPPRTPPDPTPLLCWCILPSPRRAAEPPPLFFFPGEHATVDLAPRLTALPRDFIHRLLLAHWARATPLKHDTSPAAVERPTSSPTSLSRSRNHYLDSLSCSSLPHLPIKCQTEPPRRPNPAAPPPSMPTSIVRCRSAAPDFPQPPRPSSKLCLHPVKLLGLFPLPIGHRSDLVAVQPPPLLPAPADEPPPVAPSSTQGHQKVRHSLLDLPGHSPLAAGDRRRQIWPIKPLPPL